MSSQIDAAALRTQLLSAFPELDRLGPAVFVVGGALRDALLGHSVLDLDLACRDAPSTAGEFQRRVGGTLVELGQDRFATVRVVVEGRIYDFNEIIGQAIEQDLQRRDFTINAVAFDLQAVKLIDPLDGFADLERRILRMVREENFAEDPLRVLRGVRLAVALDLSIDATTLSLMQRHAPGITTVAVERIAYELDQILSSADRSRGLLLLNDLGLDLQIFGFSFTPELIESVTLTGGNDPVVAYATLFFERGKKALMEFARGMRQSDLHRKHTLAAIEMADLARTSPHGELPVLIYDFGLETARRAVQVLYAFELDRQADALCELIEARGEQIASTVPLLEGETVQSEARITPGPEVGRLKRAVVEAQLRGQITTRDEALALIRKMRR